MKEIGINPLNLFHMTRASYQMLVSQFKTQNFEIGGSQETIVQCLKLQRERGPVSTWSRLHSRKNDK